MMATQALESPPETPTPHWDLPTGPHPMGSGEGTLPCPTVHGWGREQVTPHLGSWPGWWFCSVAVDHGQVQFPSPVPGGGEWVSQRCRAAPFPGSLLTWSLCHLPILFWFCSRCCDLFPICGCGLNPWLVAPNHGWGFCSR